jgi:glucuronosyltransferase
MFRYEENARRLSRIFRDRPQTAMETAIFWTEYVIRHRGAPHLRTAAADLHWAQYLLLDIQIVLILITVGFFLILYLAFRKLRSFLLRCLPGRLNTTDETTIKLIKSQ